MALLNITKSKVAAEDLELGVGTVSQPRGTVTQINAGVIPYDAVNSIEDELDSKDSIVSVNAKLATKAQVEGSTTQTFFVQDAATNTQAVSKGQMDSQLSLKTDLTYTDTQLALKANEVNVLLKDGTSPAFTPVSANQPATKEYVDTQIIAAGAGDMLKSVYDTNADGVVDTTAGVGLPATFNGIASHDQVMKLCQSNISNCDTIDGFGIFIGTDVVNGPVSGQIGLEQYDISSGKLQRCYAFATDEWYTRQFNGVLWSGWRRVPAVDTVVNKAGDTMTGDLVVGDGVTGRTITARGNSTADSPTISLKRADNTLLGLFFGSGSTMTIDKYNLVGDTVLTALGFTDNGNVTVNGSVPTQPNELTRKDYVDGQDALKASLTGATFTGQVKGITPAAVEDLTRKDYVDSQVATKIASTDYAQSTVGGTLKARLSGTTLYLTNNGVDA